MPNKKICTTHTVVAITTSEYVDTSESEDELNKIQKHRDNKLMIRDNSSSNDSSDTGGENRQHASKCKKKKSKKMQGIKKHFVPLTSTFSGSIPPPINSELKSIDYFYSMFGKNSFQLLEEQSNLYFVQANPNRPVVVSEIEIR